MLSPVIVEATGHVYDISEYISLTNRNERNNSRINDIAVFLYITQRRRQKPE